jgi:hypothetical protein
MDPVERTLLESTVKDALTTAHDVPAADAALSELGWAAMLDAEPRDAVGIVFTALGRTNAAATVLDDVVASALGVAPRPDLAVLLPPFGASHPPGHLGTAGCRARGLATARVDVADEIVVVCTSDVGPRAVTVPTSSVEARPVRGIDPDAGWRVVRADASASGGPEPVAAPWPAALAAGRRAIAHQIAGACRAILDLARAHAVERMQFGRPIGAFQAVRHRLADVLVAVEALEATLGAPVDAEEGDGQVRDEAEGDEPDELVAALAKLTAGRTARIVASHGQQVLAGVGFTTDHPYHRYLKRTMALEGLFGRADDVAVEVGRRLLATRRVPDLVDL